jgi:lipoprotein-anchoring transpeptidase ErfK/SrfK
MRQQLRPVACALALLLATAAGSAAAEDAGAALAPETVNGPASTTGAAAVLRAQVLLERAHFSPGQIDGGSGGNTTRAIAGFQRSRDLEPTGELDEATWTALNRDAAPVLVTHTLTPEEVAGPFRKHPPDMMEKAKADSLGYESLMEALGERFHASPALLERLNPGSKFEAGAEIVVPNVAAATPPAKPAKVVVDKSDSVVLLMDGDDRVLAQFPASTGSEHDPLPIGEWKIEGVATDPTFHYNPELFWDADPAHAKATLPSGPNNPVGVVWIDLSKEHYGIHGTPEPATIGKTESHGCIRLTNWSAKLVGSLVAPGTPAILRE